ncbi:MAG: pyridoxamine 5'-phosphate oxidase family protein [Pseudomonadota bacterium]
MKHFGDIMFTETVKAEQTRLGSRNAYATMTAQPAPEGLTERETAFIGARDSFYMATVSETGWPYVQHRGGPTGFLKALGPDKIGFADYRGNRQYVSSGHLKTDARTALILMDYPNKARLKILGHSNMIDADDDPKLAAALDIDGAGRVERLFTIQVEAFDWNCPQFITPRYTGEEIKAAAADRFARLEQERVDLARENARLQARIAELEGGK